MEILQDKVLGRHLFEKYSSNPKNWNFIISTSPFRDGFFDATVSNNEEVWQLKIDSIYKPIPMVIGTRLDADSGKLQKLTSGNNVMFGYRELGSSAIMDILERLTQEQQDNVTRESNIEGGTNLNSILSSLEPVIPVKGKDYAYGPFVYTERNHISSNEYQKNVAEQLSMKLRDNIRSRYSSYT
jgi:hypothetical protein